MREFFLANAALLDRGVPLRRAAARRDAGHPRRLGPSTSSPRVAREVRAAAAGRATIVVAENEPQHARLVRPAAEGGYGLDALWNDDFHHSARGRADRTAARRTTPTTAGTPQEFISALKYGFLYQGQRYRWQKQAARHRRASACRRRPSSPSSRTTTRWRTPRAASGCTSSTSPGRYRALTALLLLGPGTPMLFQGQEFAASAPFLYLRRPRARARAQASRRGGREFLAQFPSLAAPEMHAPASPTPPIRATFERCKLDHGERERHARGRRAAPRPARACAATTPSSARQGDGGLDGAVLGADAFVLRFFGDDGDDRLLVVNLGPRPATSTPAPEPLLAPPRGRALDGRSGRARTPRYGGCGTPRLDARRRLARPGRVRGAPRARPGAASIRRRNDEAASCDASPWRERLPVSGRRARCWRAEWLVTNGLGGYASGTVSGVPTRRYHGLLIAALPAPLGRTMMLNHLGEEVAPPRRHRAPRSAARSAPAASPDARRASTSRSSGSRPGCRSGRYDVARRAAREARLSCPTGRTPCTCTYRLRGRRAGRAAAAAPARPLPRPRGAAATRRCTEPYSLTAVDDRYEISAGPGLPTAAAAARRRATPRSRSTRRSVPEVALPGRGEPRVRRARASCGAPGYFEVDAAAPARSRRWPPRPSAGRRSSPWTPRRRWPAERARRRRLVECAGPAAPRSGGGRAGARRRPVRHHARAAASRTPRARHARRATSVRTVIAGYHWFTDWGRDTMISLEGLTLATGRHRRGRLDPAHVRALRARRPHPEHVPRGRERGAVPHRRRHALVLPRRRPLPRRHRRPRHAPRAAADAAPTSSSTTCAARASASASTRRDGLLRQGARGLPAHLDGRQGATTGWSRRAAARRSRSTRSGTTRCGCWRAGCARGGRRRGARPWPRARRARAARRSTARFWYEDGGHLYDVVDGERGRRSRLPAEPGLRRLAAAPGAGRRRAGRRCWTTVARAAADAGRPALARARPPRLQAEVLTATCARATPPTTRARCGAG